MTTNPQRCIKPESREDVVVLAVIAFVGALGVIIGLLAPERTVELTLGFVILLFVAATVVIDRRARSREPPTDT